MSHRTGDTFVYDADPTQPRVTVTIDGGFALTDDGRAIRDEMIAPFLADFLKAVRNFYVGRAQLGERR